ncbi:hypothetical protein [Acidaminobacter hydrogenoformans]|uniref:Small-conductance mechanosensitive channel n=1 Tax=Acidaminobacter hydrogenoformans DSM 2784 TaxID=1120920 RepID=A0A1G5RWT4_9FIRM|nr:hypothetical protein [Acidaminobacter hydrogenoformans]SCZ78572.1 hypothetical protein SAMN03080599_01306 [Acidaminobacter hydrogenoformans DSM 2784]
MENAVNNPSKNKSPDYERSFSRPIIKTGRWTLLIAVPLSFLPAIYLYFKYGAIPPLGNILTGWFLIASIYGSYYVIEPVSFFPVLGVSGTYMSFLAGNIGNMRLPCAAVAQEALKVEPGSHKAELVATLGIAGSIITNLIVVTIAAVAGNQLFSYFPPAVVDAFAFVLPGIFGSMFAMFALKHPRYGAFALSLVLIMLGIIKVLPVYVVIPVSVFSTIAFAVTGYKMKNKKA